MPTATRSRQLGRAFTLAGSVLALLGLVPWIGFLVGAAGSGNPALLSLGGVAVLGGAFVALLGIGFVRRIEVVSRAADERRLDAAVLATATTTTATTTATTSAADAGGTADTGGTAGPDAADCGDSCATCTASCALQSLRS